MNVLEIQKTVGQIVADNYRTAEVFKKYGIDFCCGGKKALDKACADKKVNYDELTAALEAVSGNYALPSENPALWRMDFLADYIERTHHAYIRQAIPILLEFTQKVARVHGQRHPELLDIAAKFYSLATELSEHLMKEEQVLFPYIRQISTAEFAAKPFGSVQNPINCMEAEHEDAGQLMQEIRELTDNYTPPADACTTYRVTFAKLQEFEADLHRHVHLENNILFPKAIQGEQFSAS